jgi:hypothetical protein
MENITPQDLENITDEFGDLDTSWIDEQEKELTIDKDCIREPMTNITIHFLYINTDDELEKCIAEKYNIENSLFSEEQILHIVQTHRTVDNIHTKYICDDIISYIVTIEPDHIQEYAATSDTISNAFIKHHSSIAAIHIPNSIFIFHKINCLFFIFREQLRSVPRTYKTHVVATTPLRSILKTRKNTDAIVGGISANVKHNTTKKVYFVEDDENNNNSNNNNSNNSNNSNNNSNNKENMDEDTVNKNDNGHDENQKTTSHRKTFKLCSQYLNKKTRKRYAISQST